ncbi:MAG: hypothetical protein ACREE9_00210, partial [Stellaceae bacterium]
MKAPAVEYVRPQSLSEAVARRPRCRAALTAGARYTVTAYADGEGSILGVDAEIVVDAGAYGLWPQGPYNEASMAARNLPGPY